ncbi:DNA-3-methyladenine glycosylase I [Acetobacter nitrogenifigens DSM 23921 = NBRC 105050]|uniref:DNA-3-methyladenine glycosylase I n=1 Tax=Acetobacter nitrogenifigens DSM 23921 = NBRC 105050 TaxID=1120919 RepID=A0A511X5Y5_9PROT|nr:DNA-3-methyladenine glycosylase I [Acetobacter nitrogenifigens]GBQ98625.1 DNA-3-methyladenine glycosylase I [Acetobacter nitrogenifigens DSM 23921 = NBRC 105050]GEN58340.1 DNA-3-methyladenine glycosylase I [Acetobacter nitrogenifigens DSM 23921 = NBRC 105050]
MTAPAPFRCRWAETNDLLRVYHDEEWGEPVRDSRELWETLMLEGFQAGLSWLIVLRRRETLRAAFRGFDPEIVARFGPEDVERLMGDPGVIRARAKIEAAIGNAQAYLAMREKGEDFAAFTWGMVPDAPIINRTGAVLAQSPASVAMSKALKARGFRFVGPVVVYAWMQAVGMVDDHDPNCFRCEANRVKHD